MEPNCKHWPPFYEVLENGVCVTKPPKEYKENKVLSIVAFAMPFLVVASIFYVVGKSMK